MSTKETPAAPTAPRADAEAIIAAAERLSSPYPFGLADGNEVLVLPEGKQIHSLRRFVEENRLTPERRRGTCVVQELGSFIGQTNRFKDADSVLFADRTPAKPSLLAVLDYHRAGAEEAIGEKARFGQHRIAYPFPLAAEWQAWMQGNGQKMSQGDFAAFLESRITDVLPPPLAGDLTDERFAGLLEFARVVQGTWAGPAQLVELSRGLSIRQAAKVKDVRNLASGEVQVQYETEHHDDAGQPLRVPQLFLLGIPVFEAGPAYRVAARLRYRLNGGTVTWFYELWRPDLSLRHAFDQACDEARIGTGLPLVFGTPESA